MVGSSDLWLVNHDDTVLGLEDSIVRGHRAGSSPKEIMWSHDKELRMRETPRFLLLNNGQVHWCSQVHGGK